MKTKLYLKKTLGGCPTQWNGLDTNGYLYYIRYRYGKLTIRKSNLPESPVTSPIIMEKTIGNEFDGFLSNGELKKYLKQIELKAIFLRGGIKWKTKI